MAKESEPRDEKEAIDVSEKEKFEKEIAELKKKMQALENENEKLKQQNFELRFDELTGLERRLSYFERINYGIEQIMESNPDFAKLLIKDDVSDSEFERFGDLPLTVAGADLAYLSKYNNDPEIRIATGGEHTGGDIILKETADLIQDVDKTKREIRPKLDMNTRGYRLGGDEFGLIMELPPQKAELVVAEYRAKHSSIKVAGADLPPMINIDIAHISEAARVYTKVYSREDRENMPREDQAKKLQDLMTRIADRRAAVRKGVERIDLMVDVLENDEAKFDRNYKWLGKGAFELTKDDFVKFLEKKKSDPDGFAEYVHGEVMDLLKKEKEKAQKQEAEEYEAVITIADKKFEK